MMQTIMQCNNYAIHKVAFYLGRRFSEIEMKTLITEVMVYASTRGFGSGYSLSSNPRIEYNTGQNSVPVFNGMGGALG